MRDAIDNIIKQGDLVLVAGNRWIREIGIIEGSLTKGGRIRLITPFGNKKSYAESYAIVKTTKDIVSEMYGQLRMNVLKAVTNDENALKHFKKNATAELKRLEEFWNTYEQLNNK